MSTPSDRPQEFYCYWRFALVALVFIAPAASCKVTPVGQVGASGGAVGQGGAVVGGSGGSASGGQTGIVINLDASPVLQPDAKNADINTAQAVDGQGIVNDALPDVVAVCSADAVSSTPGPLARRCAPPTNNECDGHSDINAQFPNGSFGNGFDDDCDGQVDEGCACDDAHPVGTTKPCAVVSGSEIDPGTKAPVGWCAKNSIGTMRCIAAGDSEIKTPMWDGECRGAQPPFSDDLCAPGDFDCDGVERNSRTHDCACHSDVQCPSDPIVTKPFPDPNNLMSIDGSAWVGKGLVASNWAWTVTGGDCDNILPHPTFAVYNQKNVAKGTPRLSSDKPQTNVGPGGNQHGFVIGPGAKVGPVIYPAFSLSGDYLVKGEWDDTSGHHSCTVKVQVRSPGLRFELCWSNMPSDVDLHVARLQNPKKCTHGWFMTCADDETNDDCYYGNECQTGFSTSPSTWGYPRSPDQVCHGWGSRRTAPCDNPRLDQDNISCEPAIADPLDVGDDFDLSSFCSPENTNIDSPANGERFAVGVDYYQSRDSQSPPAPQPHVNIYCNGERRLAFGFDPVATPPTKFPVLKVPGQDVKGDFWEVATVEAKVSGGVLTDCIINPIHSKTPKTDKDGSTNICVDTNPQNSSTISGETKWKFTSDGTYPTTADAFCWH